MAPRLAPFIRSPRILKGINVSGRQSVGSTKGLGTVRLGLAGLALAVSTLALNQGAHALEPTLATGTVAEAAQRLKPGEYLWAPQAAPDGPVLIIVSLATQRAIVYRNGVPIGITTVSTGKPGHETPTGIFTILQKRVDHRSNLYDDAPMPFMQRLTWGGVALHAGQLPGHPASHGCIRLPHRFARSLFGVTRLGITVVVTKETALPRVASGAGPLGRARDQTGGTFYSWHPERARKGPISIVMSMADKRMIVLRNGIQIGSAPFTLDGKVDQTAAYTLAGRDPSGPRWLRVPLPGQAAEARQLDPRDRGGFSAPAAFREALAALVVPGTTVLVTNDSLKRSGAGGELNLFVAEPYP